LNKIAVSRFVGIPASQLTQQFFFQNLKIVPWTFSASEAKVAFPLAWKWPHGGYFLGFDGAAGVLVPN